MTEAAAAARAPASCGTNSGYQRHVRLAEVPCESCRTAHRQYMADFRASHPDTRTRGHWWNKTRRMALERLAAEYPKRFEEFLEQVRAETPGGP